MPNKKYSDFIEIDPSFESSVDIDTDSRNKDLWRGYIVGDDMKNLMEKLCLSINKEEPDSRRSFWVEGTYGTGKSYAAILVKHLLEEKSDVIEDYLSSNSILSAYKNRFMRCRTKEKGDFLVIWKSGCTGIHDGNSLLMEIERAVRNALKEKFGDNADYGENSLQDAVIRHINNPMHNWDYILEHTILGSKYGNIDKLRELINSGNADAINRTADVIRKFDWGFIDGLETFKKWITAVIENNNLSKSGIFFIWDEFTEYVTNSEDHIILQQLSEFSKVQPFYMLLIVHGTKDIMQNIVENKKEKILDRFHEAEFHINTDMAFDLISNSINIRPNMESHWKDERKGVVKNIKPYLPDMSGMDDKISENIDLYCPMHPMTIKLLSRVAENYAASQRTMFRFMKDQSNVEQGFVGYINKFGPSDQACWLTPDWLWDYFFTRKSDFADKDTKAAEYIHHYEESKHLVESEENALRIFKAAMLLIAVMSSTKGIYGVKKAKDGVSATKDCLETCFAGVMTKKQVDDFLNTMVDSKILVLDESANNIVRLQLPFKNAGTSEFAINLAKNEKEHSRYKLFAKDGCFSKELEKQVWTENDDYYHRIKFAVCCAETNSIKTRLDEVTKELDKCSYKLGLLVVVVDSEKQYLYTQSVLQKKAEETDESRLVIALLKNPCSDEIRNKWLAAITKQEMAAASDQNGSVSIYKQEATMVISKWVAAAKGSAMVVYYCKNTYNDVFGMAHLRKIISLNVIKQIFKYAPENIVETGTAYKSCNSATPIAGIERTTNNSQLKNVINALKQIGVLDFTEIGDVADLKNCGNKAKESIAAVAELVKNEMESGHKVVLSDLWDTLQHEPFGYYNTIACGILLGYIFSFYKNSKYTWTDSMLASHILSEGTLNNMVYYICAAKTSTDYLSAGSVTWQRFRNYLSKIFGLSVEQLAEQNTGCQNVREVIHKRGVPFWTLKYLPASEWSSENLREAAGKIIDKIQLFIMQEGNIDNIMNDVLTLFEGRGKIHVVLKNAFSDRSVMTAAFRTFLFDASPELEEVANRLSIQPEELSDKLHTVMQTAIYTWTEEQVKEKIVDVANQYKFLEVVGNAQGVNYHSIEAAQKDLSKLFGFLRVPMSAIARLNAPWYSALHVLYNVAFTDTTRVSQEEREKSIDSLKKYGELARDCLKDGKSVLEDILLTYQIECTKDELLSVYNGLSYITFDTPLIQFDKELKAQINKISAARNKSTLLETWHCLTGYKSIKEWCDVHKIPLMCIIPKELNRAFNTLIEVQNNEHTVDANVVSAITIINNMDKSILTNQPKMEEAFVAFIGKEYTHLWNSCRDEFITRAKLKIGNDMSKWIGTDLPTLQMILKSMQQDMAKKEKLAGAKESVRTMQESVLKEKVEAFLDAHPEYCDEFIK